MGFETFIYKINFSDMEISYINKLEEKFHKLVEENKNLHAQVDNLKDKISRCNFFVCNFEEKETDQ